MAFNFKNTVIDIIMTGEDEEDCKNKNICGFCGRHLGIY